MKRKSLENRDELNWEWMKFFVFASSSLKLSVSLWIGQKAEKRKIFDALLLLFFYRPQNLFCSNKQPLNLFWAREVKTLKKQSTKKWVTILRLWLKINLMIFGEEVECMPDELTLFEPFASFKSKCRHEIIEVGAISFEKWTLTTSFQAH